MRLPSLFFMVFLAALSLLCGLLVPVQGAFALEIQRTRVGVYPDKTRVVFDLDTPAEYRVTLSDNARTLYISLPRFQWEAAPVPLPASGHILTIKPEASSGKTMRIAIALRRPVLIQNTFTLPKTQDFPDRLVVDFKPEDPEYTPRTRTPETAPAQGLSENHTRTGRPLIIIDPGHGGIDPGASGAGLQEKNVVLGLAKVLKQELEESGQYSVLLTREQDVFIKLADRVKFARQHKGDLFISIHADSVQNDHVGGASIYTLSETASDAQTEKLAARENKADLIAGIDLSTEDQEVANILVDLAMRDTMNQSKFFAGKVVSIMPRQGVSLLERPHRHAGFAVLKAPDIPSVLIEAGFMSNENEAQRMNSFAHRQKFARALHKGIDSYFEQVRKNQRI